MRIQDARRKEWSKKQRQDTYGDVSENLLVKVNARNSALLVGQDANVGLSILYIRNAHPTKLKYRH